jgi:hypothetical protein
MQSCTRQESSNDNPFKDVPIIINIDSVKLDALKFSHIQYIQLETTDECLIGRTVKVLIKDSKIYVADFNKAMALFVFDMNGKFLFKIARRGQGPGDYVSFFDFDIQSNGDIYMFDQHTKKILIYNQTGEYLRKINSDYYFFNFCLINNKMYWSKLREHGEMFANLAVYDIMNKKTEFILKDKKFLHDLSLLNFSAYDFYYSPDSIIYYSPKFSEIIYFIDENGIRPAIGIKNLNKPPKHIIDGWSQITDGFERSRMINNSHYFIENVYIYENEKYITLECIRGDFLNLLLYNKLSKKTYSSFDYSEVLGIDRVKGSTGKEFFGVIDFDTDNVYHRQILESHAELANWKEDDNPVIVLFNPDM